MPADSWAASHCVPACPLPGARAMTSVLRACLAQRRHPGLGPVSVGAGHRHAPGGSWKRPTTLFSGVLKKAAAIELYSPSAQKSCEVGREERPVGWGSPGLDSIQAPTKGQDGVGLLPWRGAGRGAGYISQVHTHSPSSEILSQATALGRGLRQDSSRPEHQLSRSPAGHLTPL